MVTLDLLVIAAISVVALFPFLGKGLAAALALARRPAPAAIEKPEGWRAGWVQTLMELQNKLEQENDSPEAIKLTRELIWLLIGGDPK